MPISRVGEKIATALQNDTVTPDEAKSIIDTAKAERKWTPELKAEVEAMLARPGTRFEGTAKADLQTFLGATPTQKDLADPAVLNKHTNLSWNPVQDGKLFVDGVNYDDVAQGYIGDCYLEGAMSAVARSSPKAIEDAVKDNGDGTYTVRFFESQGWGQAMKPVTVTVDGDLPSTGPGAQAYYAHGRDSKELWPGVIEKAYAQWKGGYEAIGNGGDPGGMMAALTGKQATYTANASLTADQVYEKIKAQATASRPMTAATFGEDQGAKYTNTGVHASHAYTVLGAGEENGKKYVELRNPWGFSEAGNDGKDDGIFKLPLQDFINLYQGTSFGG